MHKFNYDFSKIQHSITRTKKGRKLLTLNVWITAPEPVDSRQATKPSISQLWQALDKIENLKNKITEQKLPVQKQFYNPGTRGQKQKPAKKPQPLFAAAEYESDQSETGEVFVTENIIDDDW